MTMMELHKRSPFDPGAFAGGVGEAGSWAPIGVADRFRVGLLVPTCGSAGIWGPSCIASAQTAVAELNAARGIRGQEVDLILVDAALEADGDLGQTVHEMIEFNEIDAIVGMHISALRQQLAKVVRGRVPYVYTPLYEGGEESPGVYAIGETPEDQLAPAIRSIARRHKVRNWALIGNDYVWPRASHHFAKQCIQAAGDNVVLEHYVPFGADHAGKLIDWLEASQTDALLLSLIGQDAVEFNRAFGASSLDRKIVRLSCAIEENCLLAIGADNAKRLYASSSYFSVLNTPANQCFRERYHNLHGERAPALNSLGQSLYEGVHFLAELARHSPFGDLARTKNGPRRIKFRSARDAVYMDNRTKELPIYLARADGLRFSIVEKL